jgi:hypothetical protein
MVALCGFTGTKDFIMKLLHIDSSILGAHSVSRQLTRDIVSQWRASHPGTVVDYLDLAVDTPNHLSADSIGFRAAPGVAPLTEVQERENAVSEQLVSASSWRPMSSWWAHRCTTSRSPASSRPGSTVWRSLGAPSSTPTRAPKAWPPARR